VTTMNMSVRSAGIADLRTCDPMQETIGRESQPATQVDLPALGARFGRYTLLAETGRGAMATVYTAYDDQLDRKVAIKMIRDADTRVRREAQAIARVSHPNVVQVFEIGSFEGHDYIAMELVDGVDLATWQRVRSRNVYDIIARYVEAGRGLVAAHLAGVVHRDFKPENVLVDSHGRARVGDFGLARAGGSVDRQLLSTLVSSDSLETRDDEIVGTPAYMAPEQLFSPDVDERADQFSLCAALYEAVYGVRPLRGDSLAELRASARAGLIQEPPPGTRAPPTLLALLRRGLAIDPAARWPALTDLLDRLDLLDAQRDPAAAARERRRLVLAIAAACLIVVGASHTDDSAELDRIGMATMVGFSALILVVTAVGAYWARATLMTNNFHRRMIFMVLAAALGYVVVPLLARAAGFAVGQVIFIAMVSAGLLFLLAGVLITPTLLLSCVCLWGGALAIACGVPTTPVSTTTSLLSMLVLAMSWSYIPSARHILALSTDAGASRRTY
jgi:tRNA A-37 threonylcarbamoyl transferase component Bud32